MAYQSLNSAMQAAASGDIVKVRDGTYQEVYEFYPTHKVCFYVPNKSLTVQGYNDELPVLTYDPDDLPWWQDVLADVVFVGSTHDVVLEQLQITGLVDVDPGSGIKNSHGIQLTNNPNGSLTLRKLIIEDTSASGFKNTNAGFGDFLMEQCILRNCGSPSGLNHCTYFSGGCLDGKSYVVRWNVFDTTPGAGIGIGGSASGVTDNFEIYGNVAINCARQGIFLHGAGHKVYNNTVLACGEDSWGGIVLWEADTDSCEIVNNISWDNDSWYALFHTCAVLYSGDDYTGKADVFFEHSHNPTAFSHNNLKTIVTCDPPFDGYDTDGSDINIDPLVISLTPASWLDARLQAESPMIEAGGESPYNQLLDPSVTDWPTPKVVAGTLPIGAFADS